MAYNKYDCDKQGKLDITQELTCETLTKYKEDQT